MKTTDHRLQASKLAGIFDRADGLLPNFDLPVEIEHEAPVLTQLTITRHAVGEKSLEFHLEHKHTDCLAQELCLPDFSLPAIPGQSACNPSSGCC